MVQAVKQSAIVGPGGRVEVCSADLPEGVRVEVIVLLPEDGRHRRLTEFFGAAKGLFDRPEDVDRHIRELRDEWDR